MGAQKNPLLPGLLAMGLLLSLFPIPVSHVLLPRWERNELCKFLLLLTVLLFLSSETPRRVGIDSLSEKPCAKLHIPSPCQSPHPSSRQQSRQEAQAEGVRDVGLICQTGATARTEADQRGDLAAKYKA